MKSKYLFLSLVCLFALIGGIVIGSQFYQAQHIILKVKTPEAPDTAPYFRVVNREKDFYVSNELMKVKPSLPSNETALKIVKKFMLKKGGIPEDAELAKVERVMLKALNVKTGEIIRQKPLFVSVKYKRELNGAPVIGPGDEIEFAVANDILYYSKKWSILEYAGNVNIISAKEGLKLLERGSIVNKPMSIAFPLTVSDIKLGYYSDGKRNYYYPVWIFYCKDNLGNDLKLAVKAIK